MPLIAQVSDTHFDNTAETARRNDLVWDYLANAPLQIDLVLLTGDVAADGRDAEYAEALSRIGDTHPVLAIPGNHDLRPAFAAGLPGMAAADPAGPLNRAVDLPTLRVIGLDSTIPAPPVNHGGHLDSSTLAWLDDQLGTREGRSALVALHHPPVDLGHPLLDSIRLDNADELAAVMSRHDDVRGVVCGHAHAAAVTSFAGLPLAIAPGVTSTFSLGNEDADIQNRDLPPGLALHRFGGPTPMLTEYRHLQVATPRD